MNNINFGNLNTQYGVAPEIQQRANSGENFGAVDRNQLKQDAIELSTKAKDNAKENFVYRILRALGSDDPKKTLKSIGMCLATVVGFGVLGNKMSNKTASWGLKVDDFLLKKQWYQNGCKNISKVTTGIRDFFKKSKTINDISDTLKNRKAKPKSDFGRGYGRGFSSIFALTPVDILRKGFTNADDAKLALKNIVNEDLALDLSEKLFPSGGKGITDNKEFCNILSKGIREKFNCVDDNKKFFEILKQIQDGKISINNIDTDVSNLTNIKMKEKGFSGAVGSWWPVNIIDSIGHAIKKDDWKGFCRGNLGDSLIKFNTVDGKLAKTIPGKFVQKMITVPTESISNFVNDKSGMGVALCLSIIAMYNNMQDAPKGQKAAVVADDFIGTIGSIALAMPLSFKSTYALASLANLEGKTLPSKALKAAGKFFNMGLKENSKLLPRFMGGFLRLGLIMFAFSPIYSKPIQSAIHKVFGKPYDKVEEEQKQQLEQTKKQVIPELGITQGELMEKMEKNPEAIAKLQTDVNLAQAVNNNPKLLVDLLDGKQINTNASNNQNQANPANQANPTSRISPANQKYINNKTELFGQKDVKQPTNNTTAQNRNKVDSATYIPSSEYTIKSSYSSNEQQDKYNNLMSNSDAILTKAEKLL